MNVFTRAMVGACAILVFHAVSQAQPIPVKVVVVTMFEVGNDSGDTPGEFQYWVEREQLNRIWPLPHAHHDIRSNADGSVLGIVVALVRLANPATRTGWGRPR